MSAYLASVFQDTLALLVLGLVLALAGLALLREYAKFMRHDPKATMSAEILFMLITHAGAPGYLAAFLLSAAILSAACHILLSNILKKLFTNLSFSFSE